MGAVVVLLAWREAGRHIRGMEHMDSAAVIVADGESHALDVRWIAYERRVAWATSGVAALVLCGLAAAAVFAMHMPAVPVVAAAVIVWAGGTWVGYWWPGVAYRYASYRLSARSLEIRRGVLWRSVIDVPRSRIQHTDVSQGPFERMHGLGTLSVHTAGTSHSLVRLQGLDHQRALAMREHLMQADDDDVI